MKVIREVRLYFTRRRDRNYAFLIENLIRKNFHAISKDQITDKSEEWRGKIKEKDLEQLASVKTHGIRYLIAYDRDFEGFEEYITPREFIKSLKLKYHETEY